MFLFFNNSKHLFLNFSLKLPTDIKNFFKKKTGRGFVLQSWS